MAGSSLRTRPVADGAAAARGASCAFTGREPVWCRGLGGTALNAETGLGSPRWLCNQLRL